MQLEKIINSDLEMQSSLNLYSISKSTEWLPVKIGGESLAKPSKSFKEVIEDASSPDPDPSYVLRRNCGFTKGGCAKKKDDGALKQPPFKCSATEAAADYLLSGWSADDWDQPGVPVLFYTLPGGACSTYDLLNSHLSQLGPDFVEVLKLYNKNSEATVVAYDEETYGKMGYWNKFFPLLYYTMDSTRKVQQHNKYMCTTMLPALMNNVNAKEDVAEFEDTHGVTHPVEAQKAVLIDVMMKAAPVVAPLLSWDEWKLDFSKSSGGQQKNTWKTKEDGNTWADKTLKIFAVDRWKPHLWFSQLVQAVDSGLSHVNDEQKQQLKKMIETAIGKCSPQKTLHRGMTINRGECPPEPDMYVLGCYEEGAKLTHPGFMSTSSDIRVAHKKNFLGSKAESEDKLEDPDTTPNKPKVPLYLEIDASALTDDEVPTAYLQTLVQGDLTGNTGAKSESEYLLLPQSQFEVVEFGIVNDVDCYKVANCKDSKPCRQSDGKSCGETDEATKECAAGEEQCTMFGEPTPLEAALSSDLSGFYYKAKLKLVHAGTSMEGHIYKHIAFTLLEMFKIFNEQGIKEVDERQDGGVLSPIWVKPEKSGGKIKNFFKNFKSQCKNRSPWNGHNFLFYDQRTSTGRREFKSKPLSGGDFDACAEGNGCRVCVLEETVGEYKHLAQESVGEYRRLAEDILYTRTATTYRCSSHCGSGTAAGFTDAGTDAGPPEEAVVDRATIKEIEKEYAESRVESI
jgi:hypothetical protein